MFRAKTLLATAFATIALGAGAAHAVDDPMNALMGREKFDTACFTRTYGPDFLAAHPLQRTQAVTASFYVGKNGPDEGRWYWMAFHETGEAATNYVTGGCAFAEDWTDMKGRPGRKTWEGDACFVSVGIENSDRPEMRPDDLHVEVAKDGQSVLVRTGSFLSVHSGEPGQWTRKRLALGRDDRVFRLDRADASLCQPKNASMDTLD